jgi:hypothetical protein
MNSSLQLPESIAGETLRGAVSIATALANPKQPEATFIEIDRVLGQSIGHKLFTILAIDYGANLYRRVYSSAPRRYPVGSTKPVVRGTKFYRDLVDEGLPRLCRDQADCMEAFGDHELIQDLGCGSAINFPVRWGVRTLGELNVLHEAHWYDTRSMDVLRLCASLAIAPLLAASAS